MVAFFLSGCASAPDKPNGCIAYQPGIPLVATLGRGCATQLTPHWAVSARHVGKIMVAVKTIDDPDYDLLFFRHDGTPAKVAQINRGDRVYAEGNPETGLDYLVPLPVATLGHASGEVVSTTATLCSEKGDSLFAPSVVRLKCAAMVWVSRKGSGVDRFQGGYSGAPLSDGRGRIVGVIVGHAGAYEAAYPITLVCRRFVELVKDRGGESCAWADQ